MNDNSPKAQSVCKHCGQLCNPNKPKYHIDYRYDGHDAEPMTEPASTGEQPRFDVIKCIDAGCVFQVVEHRCGFAAARPSEPSAPQPQTSVHGKDCLCLVNGKDGTIEHSGRNYFFRYLKPKKGGNFIACENHVGNYRTLGWCVEIPSPSPTPSGYTEPESMPQSAMVNQPLRDAAKRIQDVLSHASLDEIRYKLRNLVVELREQEPIAPTPAQGTPEPPKVKEIAQRIAGELFRPQDVGIVTAILRPYFPPASQTPDFKTLNTTIGDLGELAEMLRDPQHEPTGFDHSIALRLDQITQTLKSIEPATPASTARTDGEPDKEMLEAIAEDGLLVTWDKDFKFNFSQVVRLMAEFVIEHPWTDKP